MILDKEKLQDAMVAACVNVSELAEMSGVGMKTIRKLTLTDGKATTKTVGLLSKALGIPYRELLKEA